MPNAPDHYQQPKEDDLPVLGKHFDVKKELMKLGIRQHTEIAVMYSNTKRDHPSLREHQAEFFPYFLNWIKQHSTVDAATNVKNSVIESIAKCLKSPIQSIGQLLKNEYPLDRDIDPDMINIDAIYNEFLQKNGIDAATRTPIPDTFKAGAQILMFSSSKSKGRLMRIQRRFQYGDSISLEYMDVPQKLSYHIDGVIVGCHILKGERIQLIVAFERSFGTVRTEKFIFSFPLSANNDS